MYSREFNQTRTMNQELVKTYYGQTLTTSDDLQTDACCAQEAPPPHVRAALARIHPEVAARYYGCGLVIPPRLEGLNVLDLGSGAGRDAFTLACLVGEAGSVTGVDMTPEQLAVARKHEQWHANAFGYAHANTRFLEGYLEDLQALDLEPNSFDLIISNCVINLCTDKPAVFEAAYNLLKPGGELYFSDVYADRRIPDALRSDPVLYGECLSGALYWNDYLSIARAAGFADPRVCDHRPLTLTGTDVKAKLEPIQFASVTARLFKLVNPDASCEDYGQAVLYDGGVKEMPTVFELDVDHQIERGGVFPVCRNTLKMLTESRFADHFEILGEGTTHLGAFPGCGAPNVFGPARHTQPTPEPQSGGCC